jgi:membrane protein required for colicin V production
LILDIAGIALIVLLFIRGYRKGFIVAVFSMLAVLLGIVCALKLSHRLAEFLAVNNIITASWGLVVSYLVLFLGALWLVRLGADFIERTLKALALGFVNKLSGGILYAASGVILWSACIWLANQAHFFSPELLTYSRTYPYFVPIAPWAFDGIGTILPLAKDLFSDLERFFSGINHKLPGHVGTH